MLWENLAEESCDVCECTSLISNSFTLNSGGRSPSVRRAEARNRGVQRRLNMAPTRMIYNDDENCSSPVKNMSIEELSFYSGNSPQASPRPCSISPCMELSGLLSPENSPSRFTVVQQNRSTNLMQRQISDDHDVSSMDSGYSASYSQDNTNDSKSSFKFLEPCGIAPRRIDPSPRKLSTNSLTASPKSTNSFRMFHSLSSSSMESTDDELMELFEMESLDEDTQLPADLNNLISGVIKTIRTTPDYKRPLIRRCLSVNESLEAKNRVRSALFEVKTPEILKQQQVTDNNSNTPYSSRTSFKRPEAPIGSPIQSKRYKCETEVTIEGKENDSSDIIRRPILRKSISMNDSIISALARSSCDSNLIGDFTKRYVLPYYEGRHSDLRSINAETMANLLNGDFNDKIASFKIIDCRYPYEYNGGHIKGAKNLYTHDQVLDEFVNNSINETEMNEDCDEPKRNILVFHCEFSSERGPKLSRFLRNSDRSKNTYPELQYPEIYLLHGGYKEFFESYKELCTPETYLPMLHPSYTASYKEFRAKTKSWTCDVKASVVVNRLVKSRSRLVL